MSEDFLNKNINSVIQGNCLEVMKQMPDKCVDLVLTDPPYGIGADKGSGGGSKRGSAKKYDDDWDSAIPTKEYFDEIRRISKNQIIFGGNYFIEVLKNSPCWLVWDKREGLPERTFADAELAWTSFESPTRIFRFKWDGMIQEYMGKMKEVREHPTQKPHELMKEILLKYSTGTDVILDCFSGSGSTLVAAKQLGRRFIGIEISEKYCEIARGRLRQEILL